MFSEVENYQHLGLLKGTAHHRRDTDDPFHQEKGQEAGSWAQLEGEANDSDKRLRFSQKRGEGKGLGA